MPEPCFDPRRAERFREHLVETLNGAALALMTSLGHRTGLFDVMSRLEPATSETIALQAGLDERYVREWLAAMATGGFVEYDAASGCFRLPPEHAAALTREARPGNLAVTCQWIPLLGAAEDRIVECFARGGGLPYSAYGRFHAVMSEESDQTVVSRLVEDVLPLVAGAPSALESGIDVLDVGCGSGRALCRMARAFPRSRFTGYDVAREPIACARAEARALGLANVRFEVRDASKMDHRHDFDLVTAFDAIHDQARPEASLRAVAEALRPDGSFLMQECAGTSRLDQDASHPMAPFLYAVSCLHCMSVSLAAGGAGLGAMWGAASARRMLARTGFEAVAVHELPHDPMSRYFVARTAAESRRVPGAGRVGAAPSR